jgi:enoyl-[acyl-carrier protein] reductase I
MAYNLLKGKKGIIFGALNEQSIAWKVAQRAVQEGAEIVLSNAPIALRMGELNKLAEECNAPVIGADVTSNDDINNLFTKTKEHFGGGVDFILHSIGMSINVRKNIPYPENNYDFTHKGFDISALSLHRILQAAMKHDAIND